MAASLNPYISKFDEVFSAEQSSQYKMTIQFALDGLSFAILDTESQRLIALEYYQSDLLTDSNELFHLLEKALESKGINNKVFHSVTCIIDERTNLLVPEILHDNEANEKWLNFSFHLPDGYTQASERLEALKAYNAYAYPAALHNKIIGKWKNAHITHSSSVFINSVVNLAESNASVFVNFRNRDFDMLIQKEGRLQFFNNFKFNTKDDCVYFLLFSMEQNGLSGHNTPVYFSGLIRPASEIIDLCGRYVKDIKFVEDPCVLKVSEALEEVPFQYYFIHYQALR